MLIGLPSLQPHQAHTHLVLRYRVLERLLVPGELYILQHGSLRLDRKYYLVIIEHYRIIRIEITDLIYADPGLLVGHAAKQRDPKSW